MIRFRAAISIDDAETEMAAYAFRVAMTLIGERDFRDTILKSLVGIYAALKRGKDYVNM